MKLIEQLLHLFTPVTPSPLPPKSQTATQSTSVESSSGASMAEYLRRKWFLLRLYRTRASFMFDYQLLQHFSHLMRMGK